MEKKIYDSLELIFKKYQSLETQLQSEKIMQDINLYTEISKEKNKIEEIYFCFKDYKKNLENISDIKKLLDQEKDPELLEIFKNELQNEELKTSLLEKKLKIFLLPKDKNDNRNVIVELRGAAGGDEANIFVGDLFKIYQKWCELNEWKIKVIDASPSLSGGFSQLVFIIRGKQVYSKMKFEAGVHRVQRVPQTETQGRVHTSTITCTVFPEFDETEKITINPSEIKVDTYRSSGAGGQSVNTTDSAVRITHLRTGIIVTSQNERSQIANKDTAIKVLKNKLYELEEKKKLAEEGDFRKAAGSGARSEKIRTYNYPQDRVTDHRINFSMSLKTVKEGKIFAIIDALIANDQAKKIDIFEQSIS